MKDLSRAIELHPRYAEAHLSRGLAYRQMVDGEAALADLTRAIEIGLAPSHRFRPILVPAGCLMVAAIGERVRDGHPRLDSRHGFVTCSPTLFPLSVFAAPHRLCLLVDLDGKRKE